MIFLHGLKGYGRKFRERLLGQWGVVDVNDCCSCATFLVYLIRHRPFSYFRVEVVSIYASVILIIKVETGRVDAQRLCVTGESAGGFTTLACLAFRQIFKAGSSLYGASLRFP